MREGASKWVAWTIIAVVIITLTLWGISYYFMEGSASTQNVVKVNGHAITVEDLTNSLNRLRQQQPQLFSTPDAEARIKDQLLTQLTNQSVLSQAAERQGFAVNQAQLDSFITSLPAFQVNHQFSNDQFNMVLNRLLYTPSEFMSELRDTFLINQVQNGLAASAFALPSEATRLLSLINQKRDIGYILIPSQNFAKKIKLNDQQINAYYQQNQSQFENPEQVSLDYVMLTPAMVTNAIQPTAGQLMSYYQDNLGNYTTPARWHVAHILLSIPVNANDKTLQDLTNQLSTWRAAALKGTDFASLAKQHSQDVLSSTQGGVIPWFTAGSLGGAFEQAVAQLKPGEISQPVRTQYGLEIIKLLDAVPQTVKPYNQVAANVKQAYIGQQQQALMDQKNDDLANSTFENPTTLEPAAKQLGLTIQSTGLFTRSGLKTGIANNPAIISAAFSDDVLAQGNNSDVITLKDGSLIVLRVRQHIAAAVKPLAEVKNVIINQLTQAQAIQQATLLANQLSGALVNAADPAAIAAKNGLVWRTASGVARTSQLPNTQVVQQAFNLPLPTAEQKRSVQSLVLPNGDAAVVALMQVVNAKQATLSAAQQIVFQKQTESILGQANYASYVKEQLTKASIQK